jgi:crotonobetainyl-CoA:carnitine CoA-transferase CaiB-like acyl-CoA transferase
VRPFADIRVLDFGTAAVGPLATTSLGLLGALSASTEPERVLLGIRLSF